MDTDRWNRRWERRQRRGRRIPGAGAPFAGIVIIGIGALFLLQNLGFIYARDYWQYWPVLLIALGVSKLVSSEWGGAILAILGGVFLAINLGYLDRQAWQYLWPLFLIGGGVILLLRGMGVGCQRSTSSVVMGASSPPSSATPSPDNSSPENYLNIHIAFSTVERRIISQDFEGGDIHVAFGAAEIDLRNARTKKNEIYLNVHAAFGGIELMVPETWTVDLRGHGAFGAFEDKTHSVNFTDQAKPRLILTGSAAFGGVTVRN
jgi:predicted membrane protein